MYPEQQREKFLKTLKYKPLTQEQISEISELPYITSVDTRVMTASVSEAYNRPDDGEFFYNYTTRVVIEGTLTRVQYGKLGENLQASSVEEHFNQLFFEECELLAGNGMTAGNIQKMMIYAYPLKLNAEETSGTGGMLERIVSVVTQDYLCDTEYAENMTIGERYVFILRFEPLSPPTSMQRSAEQYYDTQKHTFYLGDHLSDYWCDTIWPLEDVPDNYLETEEYAPLRDLIEITNRDVRTFDMVYTEDMASIMRFAEGRMAIVDGRGLSPADSESESAVCVISRDVAVENDLAVGDTIEMKLGEALFEQYKGLGAVAASRDRYGAADRAVTLEIVGLYADLDDANSQQSEPNWSYSLGTIFVPKSLLPEEAVPTDHAFAPGEFSFKVENAWDIPAFLEETAPRIEAMGLTLRFTDGGWLAMEAGFRDTGRLSMIKIAILAVAVLVATWFTVYLFIGRKKREYGIMRALGTTKRASANALMLPLSALTILSVLVGSGAAWLYTTKTIAGNNALAALEEFAVNTSVPLPAALGCIVGEIALTLLFALLMLRQMGKLSPLALLQSGGAGRGKGGRKQPKKPGTPQAADAASPAVPTSVPFRAAPGGSAPAPVQGGGKSRSVRFVLGYIGRHMRRVKGKIRPVHSPRCAPFHGGGPNSADEGVVRGALCGHEDSGELRRRDAP